MDTNNIADIIAPGLTLEVKKTSEGRVLLAFPNASEINFNSAPLTLAWVSAKWLRNYFLDQLDEGFPDIDKRQRVKALVESGQPLMLPLLNAKTENLDSLYFVDGRHRAEYFLTLGMNQIPVGIPVDALHRLLGRQVP